MEEREAVEHHCLDAVIVAVHDLHATSQIRAAPCPPRPLPDLSLALLHSGQVREAGLLHAPLHLEAVLWFLSEGGCARRYPAAVCLFQHQFEAVVSPHLCCGGVARC